MKVEEATQLSRSPNAPWALYYAATPQALVLTLQEEVLKRALDRLAAKGTPNGVTLPSSAVGSALFGEAREKFIELADRFLSEPYTDFARAKCFDNLPILNEWKRIFPDRDPAAVHEKVWKTALRCPGGGSYEWNSDLGSMQSTIFGHPAQPKTAHSLPNVLEGMTAGSFSLGFEDDGLRAKVELQRTPPR